jgi:hypothetical protein
VEVKKQNNELGGLTPFTKEMFIEYAGSHFQMQRDCVLGDYKAFNVSRDQELAWGQQLINEYLHHFEKALVVDSTFYNLVSVIESCGDINGLLSLLSLLERKQCFLDTFTLILVEESLLETLLVMAEDGFLEKGAFTRLVDRVSCCIERLPEENFNISEYYKSNSTFQPVPGIPSTDTLSEDSIHRRIVSLKEKMMGIKMSCEK